MINEEMLIELRTSVSLRMSKKRFEHTLGVEKATGKLASIWLPERTTELAAAALLHDISKEMPEAAQIELILREEPLFSKNDLKCTPALHSFSAPYVVKCDFPLFATEDILSAVGKHTLGDVEMSVFDEIIFLADFIEESRTYPNAVRTRNFVFDSIKCRKTDIKLLHKACIMEIESTISFLTKEGREINERALLAKETLLSKI